MNSITKRVTLAAVGAGFLLGVTFCFGMAVGSGTAWFSKSESKTIATVPESDSMALARAEMESYLLRAGTASPGKKLAVATGQIDQDIEGVFVLDFLTGDLFCWVINRFKGGLGGRFRINVAGEFGGVLGNASDFVLTTGLFRQAGRSSQLRMAECIVYVADGNTGKVVGYSLPWNRTRAQAGAAQEGPFQKVFEGLTRSANIERD